jgi:nonsense-mediated mRNA decay protein 3
VPARSRHDRQLVSHDTHTAEYNYKYTMSTEIVPICKDDLICLPAKLAHQLGQLGPLVLCTKVRHIRRSAIRNTNFSRCH